MLKDIFDFLAVRGLLSPGILALAVVVIVYFQSGVDAEQRSSIQDLQVQDKIITAQLQATSENLKITAALLGRIDQHGTQHEMQSRENDLSRREADLRRGK